MITFKYRIYPDKEQQTKLWSHSCAMNKLYNYFLDQRIRVYKEQSVTVSRYDQQKQLSELKKQDPVLAQIHSQVLQQVPLRLDNTYQAFFKNYKQGQGFPNFRSCRNFFSITYPQGGYKVQEKVLYTKVYGNITLHKHTELKGNIKQVTITCKNNKWFVCITTDYVRPKQAQQNTVVGIDVGITNLVATSDGTVIKNKRHAKYFDNKIKKLQQKRSNCKKGSNSYKFYSTVINRLYGAKNSKINDFQHKVSKTLSCTYDTIIVEDLRVKQMSESQITGLNRELRNSKITNFVQYLTYKASTLVKVNPRNTSKTCNSCGTVHNMPLYKRIMNCSCGYTKDRDLNAALNICCLGQAIISGVCKTTDTIQQALELVHSTDLCTGSPCL